MCLAISLSSGAAVLEDNHEFNAYTEVVVWECLVSFG